MTDKENIPEVGSKPKAKGRGAVARGGVISAAPASSESFIDGKIIRDVTKVTDDRIVETRKALEAQERVVFFVPLAPGENPNSLEFVSINGFSMEIRKGSTVSMPRQIVEMIAEKYQVEMTAGANMRIDRDDKNLEALS